MRSRFGQVVCTTAVDELLLEDICPYPFLSCALLFSGYKLAAIDIVVIFCTFDTVEKFEESRIVISSS